MMELVKCSKCAEDKPRDAFHKYKRSPSGVQSYCKACALAYNQARPDTRSPEYRRDEMYRLQYGISLDIYNKMHAAQAGACAVCKDTSTPLVVDHNHDTKEVRGLLCRTCNTGLGQLKDSPSVLEAALVYLKERGHYGRQATSGA